MTLAITESVVECFKTKQVVLGRRLFHGLQTLINPSCREIFWSASFSVVNGLIHLTQMINVRNHLLFH